MMQGGGKLLYVHFDELGLYISVYNFLTDQNHICYELLHCLDMQANMLVSNSI